MHQQLNHAELGINIDKLPDEVGQARIGQLGFLVEDLDYARRECGKKFSIKHWYLPQIRDSEIYSGGARLDQRFSIAVGYTGRLQIEIFRVAGQDKDVLYCDRSPGEINLHHIGFFVGDIYQYRQRMRGQNVREIQSGQFSFARRSRTKFAYFDTEDQLGTNIEFIENRFRNRRVDMYRWFIWSAALLGVVETSPQEDMYKASA